MDATTVTAAATTTGATTLPREDAAPSPREAGRPLLRLRGIEKSFGAVRALAGIDLDVYPGEVLALAGDNGAGKSVLIKCIAGTHRPDAGTMEWEGHPVTLKNPAAASALGIETVYQDLALCDNLDVAANLFLGREPTRHEVLDTGAMEAAAERTLRRLDITTLKSVHQLVRTLSGGQRQAIAVAKAMLWESKLVIMDEPTAALGVAQTAMVLDLVRRLADTGVAVILISHNMNEVLRVADRVAVLYRGNLVASGPVAEFDHRTIVELMTSGRRETVTT